MKLARVLIASMVSIASANVGAVQCSLSAQGVAFGTYDVFSNQAADSTGNVAVTCDSPTPYSIAISAGSASFTMRTMSNGANRLNYNLFTDASRTAVWGDGTGGSSVVSGSAASANYTVFGREPARQNVGVGNYADYLVVTLVF